MRARTVRNTRLPNALIPNTLIAAGLVLTASLGAGTPLRAAPGNDYRGPDKGDWNTANSWNVGAVPNGSGGTYYDATNSSASGVVHSSSLGAGGVDTVNSLSFTGKGGLTLSGGTLAGSQPGGASTFSVSGPLLIQGGTLSNFTLLNSDAAAFSGGGNTLTKVRLSGGLTVGKDNPVGQGGYGGVNASVLVSGSFSCGAGASFQVYDNSVLTFAQSQTLDSGSCTLGGNTYGGSLAALPGAVLTLGPGFTASGPFGHIGADRIVNNGTVAGGDYFSLGSGEATGSGITNNGTLRAGQYDSLYLVALAVTNTGTITATGGGLVQVNNAINPYPRPTLDNQGVVFVGAGSQMLVQGFQQSAASARTQVDGTLNTAVTLLAGTLSGAGTVSGSVTNTGGTIAPGDTGGTLTILKNSAAGSGAYTQGAGGTFLEQLGGTGADQYGVLSVGGLATLGGTLGVSVVNGFAPSVGQTFTFLNFGSFTGAFASVTGLGQGYGYSVSYGANSATLTVTSAAAAPEPSQDAALGLGALGLAALAVTRRRFPRRLRA